MENFQEQLQLEQKYLTNTLRVIDKELIKELSLLVDRKKDLVAARKDMWENTNHYSTDFEKMTEVSQHLALLEGQTATYANTRKRINSYNRIKSSPYFGRFDFVEDTASLNEQIYIGLSNVTDSESFDIVVYDWRAPISSVFYQYELGKASYISPAGVVEGKVLLKRQYKIKACKLDYFFDCNVKIDDEMLQQVLSRSSSPQMRNIVETIQKEQDKVIRDTENELLIVQGVAGSGKTSIALHRIAFLLYNGISTGLKSNNIVILSPNEVFGKYISSVLPELGEENVGQLTFDELAEELIGREYKIEKRNERLEYLISHYDTQTIEGRKSCIAFKESPVFIKILDRMLDYYLKNVIKFEDIYYDGRVIEAGQLMKTRFFNDKTDSTIAHKLKRIEAVVLNAIHPLQRPRVKKIEGLIQTLEGHDLDVKSFSRLMSIKESNTLLKRIRRFTEVNYFDVYSRLFNVEGLFEKLTKDSNLPDDIERIIHETKANLCSGNITYEDCAPLMYLKLKIEGSSKFLSIRHVVVDEAQDYSPLQYEIYKLLFRYAGFTILGDMHQAIEKNVDISLYDTIDMILNKRKSIKLFLNKSYRSSYEISRFAQGIQQLKQDCVAFERHEEKPETIRSQSSGEMLQKIIKSIAKFREEGHESIAVICKSENEAEALYGELKKFTDIRLIKANEEIQNGVLIISAYTAKGLEFDAVIVHDISKSNYHSELDRKLLYVACTRALHRLVLNYTGDISPLIKEQSM